MRTVLEERCVRNLRSSVGAWRDPNYRDRIRNRTLSHQHVTRRDMREVNQARSLPASKHKANAQAQSTRQPALNRLDNSPGRGNISILNDPFDDVLRNSPEDGRERDYSYKAEQDRKRPAAESEREGRRREGGGASVGHKFEES